MVNVTKVNFLAESNDLISRLPTAAFVAIDEEMTGITLPNSSRPPKDHTPSQRYQHLKAVPETYSIIQLGICLFHQHPDYLDLTKRGLPCPEFVARRYNFYMFPPADHRSTRQVVLNPSSIAFLNQHNMNFNLWTQEGIPYVTGEAADDLLSRFQEKQSEKREESNDGNQKKASTSSPYARRRVELRRTEDINFHARTMASLREWLDSAQPPAPPPANQQPPAAGYHGPEDAAEGLAYLLPPANSFLRRALYESIELEYPTLVLESAGAGHPNQIRVLRLNPEEHRVRKERVMSEAWQDLIVNRIGMWRIFSALSLACQGFQIPFDSITFAESVDCVDWERGDAEEDVANLVPMERRIPVIVHNGLMDLLFLMTAFHNHSLPATYPEAKALVHNYFPVIYDTKLLSTECTPPSLWNDSTTLENLYRKVIDENHDMENAIDLLPDAEALNGLGNLAGNEEQMHEAAYDAFMTGAVYCGLCHLIASRARYFCEPPAPSQEDIDASRVASLYHLLLREDDEYVTTVFGCNKLYLMQSVYVIDLASIDQDPLNRGMIGGSIFRVSDCDPSVNTRAIVQCISGLLDSRYERVNYEIFWVDGTTFLVAATRNSSNPVLSSDLRRRQEQDSNSSPTTNNDEKAILTEHGEIILRALRNRFKLETIERWNDYVNKVSDSETTKGSNGHGGFLSRATGLLWGALGWFSDDGGIGRKRMTSEAQNDSSSPTTKRRRII